MFSNFRKPVRFLTSAALLASGLGLFAVLNTAPVAHADPQYEASTSGQPFACVGSDTIQDLFNAFAGQEPSEGPEPSTLPALASKEYTPIESAGVGQFAGDTSNSEGIASFDALDPHLATPATNVGDNQQIVTKLNGVSMDRPNGSGDGRKALSDSLTGAIWSNANNTTNGQTITSDVDCARSSSKAGTATAATGPDNTAGEMSYVSVAGDSIPYAFHCATAGTPDCLALGHLTSTMWFDLYSAATVLGNGDGILSPGTDGWLGGANTVNLKACAIQTGSGTFQYFLAQAGLGSDFRATAQTNLQNATFGSGCTGIEENALGTTASASGFVPIATAKDATADWVIPMSMGNITAQYNGVALNRSSAFFNAGSADIAGNGIAPVSDAFSLQAGDPYGSFTLTDSPLAGATAITVSQPIQVGSTLDLNFNNADFETVEVSGPGAVGTTIAAGGSLTVPALKNAHVAGEAVTFDKPYLNDGGTSWTDLTASVGSDFGRHLFVLVPSTEIFPGGRGINHGLADLFFSQSASSGTAAICSAASQAEITTFGFDTTLPVAGQYTVAGTCGHVEFVQTGAA
jgi:hypothetical protein